MSIFRKPLGAYTRSTPEWFVDNSATAGFFNRGFNQAGNGWAEVALYNDSTAGEIIQLNALDFFTDLPAWLAYTDVGVNGTSQGPGSPLVSGGATPRGQVYWSPQPTPNRFQQTNQGLSNLSLGISFDTALYETHHGIGPLALIRAGYSYRIAVYEFGPNLISVNFYWTVLPMG